LQLIELDLHFCAQLEIERVEQRNGRIENQRAGQWHTLTLTA
jgi:hypothetical protein